ncbi:MAG: proline dehydrogenase family protein, partial [Acidimicrobiia bacterium]|nr:proline dehydrogenase family protein [Acidimicrobiia bacterium]
ARGLNARGFLVSLDHLGEHVTDLRLAAQARDGYLEAIDRIAAESLEANISVKLTQLGLGRDDAFAEESLRALAARAAAAGTTVTVDMEESALTQVTVDLYCRVQADHGNLGLALQAYLHRTPADLARVMPLGGHLRLCKGGDRRWTRPSARCCETSWPARASAPRWPLTTIAWWRRPASWPGRGGSPSSSRCSTAFAARCRPTS